MPGSTTSTPKPSIVNPYYGLDAALGTIGAGWYGLGNHMRHLLIAPFLDQAGLDEYLRSRTVNTGDQPADEQIADGSRYGSPQQFNISTRLIRGCAAPSCLKTKDLSRCPTCKAAAYCSHEHQYSHRPGHRSVCTKIKKAQAIFDKEERASRLSESNNIFADGGWGYLWGIRESREYMRTCVALVEALLKTNTALAVSMSLSHLLEMLRLCRTDPTGARDLVPALYLRLGRDQEAYDFCRWWATTGHDVDHYCGDLSMPYLDTRDADVFEGVEIFTSSRGYLPHLVTITVLKIRLLIDLQSLQRAKELAGPYVPREILDTIQEHCTFSTVTSNTRITKRENQAPHIAKLRVQVKDLYVAVQNANSYFWPAMTEPGDNLRVRPTSYGSGDKGQMQVVLQHTYNVWAETPGAIGVVEELLKRS
jgi:hypothetical protein